MFRSIFDHPQGNMLENFKTFKTNTIILMCCFNKVILSAICWYISVQYASCSLVSVYLWVHRCVVCYYHVLWICSIVVCKSYHVLYLFGCVLVYWCGSAGVGRYPGAPTNKTLKHKHLSLQNNTPTYSLRPLRMNVITFETCRTIKNFHKVTSSWFSLFN